MLLDQETQQHQQLIQQQRIGAGVLQQGRIQGIDAALVEG